MKMSRKTLLKLLLDVVMLLVLTLLYRKNVLGIAFHEIAGLALFGLFLVHHVWNGKWSVAATKRIFSKGMPGLVRAQWIVDLLLAVAFCTIVVTGALMSKVVFSFGVQGNFKTLHYFMSALAIILMGVHLGLHTSFLLAPVKRLLTKKAPRVAGIALLCVALAFGCYSAATTSFPTWLAMPFSGARGMEHGAAFGGGALPDGVAFPEGETGGERPQDGSGRGAGKAAGNGQGNGLGHGGGETQSFGRVLLLVCNYLSIMLVFATLTDRVVAILQKRRREKR